MHKRHWAQVTVSKQYREHAFCKCRPRQWLNQSPFRPRAEVSFPCNHRSENTTEERSREVSASNVKSTGEHIQENNHTPPKVFCFAVPPPGNASLASYFASKLFTCKTPHPLRISNDIPWGGYGRHLQTLFDLQERNKKHTRSE